MWFSTESVKSVRYWNPCKIHVKESFFILSYLFLAVTQFYKLSGKFPRILLVLKVTYQNLSNILRKKHFLSFFVSRYSSSLYKMKLNFLFIFISFLIQNKIFQWQLSVWHKATFLILNHSIRIYVFRYVKVWYCYESVFNKLYIEINHKC